MYLLGQREPESVEGRLEVDDAPEELWARVIVKNGKPHWS
jgi:hypothetical protein